MRRFSMLISDEESLDQLITGLVRQGYSVYLDDDYERSSDRGCLVLDVPDEQIEDVPEPPPRAEGQS